MYSTSDKNDLIQFVESEVTILHETRKAIGINKWSLYAAIGTISYLLYTNHINQIFSFHLFSETIGIYFLAKICVSVINDYRDEDMNPIRETRFILTNKSLWGHRGNELLFLLFALSLFINHNFYYSDCHNYDIAVFLKILSGVLLLGILIFVIFQYIEYPMPYSFRQPKNKFINSAVLVVFGLWFIFDTYCYYLNFWPLTLPMGFYLASIVSILWMIEKLNEIDYNRPTEKALIQIRRDLWFDKLTTTQANKLIEITLYGLRFGDIFQKKLNTLVLSFRLQRERLNSCEQLVGVLQSKIKKFDSSEILPAEKSELKIEIKTFIASIRTTLRETQQDSANLESEYRKFRKKVRALQKSSNVGSDEVSDILSQIESEKNNYAELRRGLIKEIQSYKSF